MTTGPSRCDEERRTELIVEKTIDNQSKALAYVETVVGNLFLIDRASSRSTEEH